MAFPLGDDPHINVVLAHDFRQDAVELLLPHQAQIIKPPVRLLCAGRPTEQDGETDRPHPNLSRSHRVRLG